MKVFALGSALLFAVLAWAVASVEEPDVTFTEHVAPLIYANCVTCHSPGGPAPFSLLTYEDVRKRAELVQKEILTREMPPGLPLSDFGKLAKPSRLTDEHLVMIQQWVREGAKEGPNKPLPPAPEHGWSLGQPSRVIEVGAASYVGESEQPNWKAYRIPSGLTSKKYLYAFDIIPDSPAALRNAQLAVDRTGWSKGAQWTTFGSLMTEPKNLIGSWAPSFPIWKLPAETGIALDDDDNLVVQAHYQPTGKSEPAGFKLGLYFRDIVEQHPVWLTIGSDRIYIPYLETPTLRAQTKLEEPVTILALLPEARFYCNSITLRAELPSGENRIVFQRHGWDPFWAGSYVFEKPVALPKGTTLRTEYEYDNGVHSALNENITPRAVRYGPGLYDELFWMHIQYLPK